jgi:hypothetical protein
MSSPATRSNWDTSKYFSKEMIRITSRGIQYVEGDLVQQAASRVTFNVRNAYGSSFGTQQHAEMSVSFEFSTVEAGLDRAEEEIEQRGGRHVAALKQLIAEIRTLHEGGKSVGRGSFARHLEVIQRKGWIWGPIAGTLLSLATGA